jgi:Flp pilus assembly protein CpaB
VVVAAADLPRGTVLGPGSIRVEGRPGPSVPPGAIEASEAATGRILAAAVSRGEILTDVRLAPPGGPVASLVPPGLRAMPVAASLPRGTVAPGDHVDVLATSGDRPFAETVVAGAEVLLVVEAPVVEGVDAASTLILLVTPDDAARLAHARALAEMAVAVAPSPDGALGALPR